MDNQNLNHSESNTENLYQIDLDLD